MKTLLSLREAADMWSIRGGGRSGERWLRRFFKRREKEHEREILIRQGKRRYVTLHLMREHMPDLFDRRTEMARKLREELEFVTDKLREHHLRMNGYGARLRNVQGQADESTKDIAALFGAVSHLISLHQPSNGNETAKDPAAE